MMGTKKKDTSIGRNIKKYRKMSKLTQHELAEKTNLSRSYIADIENDRYNPSVDTLKSIAKALDVPVHYLIEENDTEQKNIPPWATKKDIRDFRKLLEEEPLMFDGMPLDDEDKEKILRVVEAVFWDAKKRNKRKPIDE